MLQPTSSELAPRNVSTCPGFRTARSSGWPGGARVVPAPRLERRQGHFSTCAIRGSTCGRANRWRLLIGRRVGANAGDQTRPAAGPTQRRPRLSPAGLLEQPRAPSGDGRSPWRSATRRFRPAADHAASLRPEPPRRSGRGIPAPRRGSAGGPQAREPATPQPRRVSGRGDVGQGRRRLREGGFSADRGRWFCW